MGVYEGYISLRVKKAVLFVGIVCAFIVMQKRRKRQTYFCVFYLQVFFIML